MAVEVGSYIGDDDGNRVSVVASADAVTVNDGEGEVVIPRAMVQAVAAAMREEARKGVSRG